MLPKTLPIGLKGFFAVNLSAGLVLVPSRYLAHPERLLGESLRGGFLKPLMLNYFLQSSSKRALGTCR